MRYPLDRPPVFTLTTGPVDAYREVLSALGGTVLYDYDPAFRAHYERVARKAQEALGHHEPPVILQGEPVLALEAAAASLIAREDVVLNLASGVYGKGFGFWAARYAKRVDEIEVPYNEVIDPAAVAAHLAAHPDTKVVAVCHHDTPSGTINDIDAIGAVVAQAGALLLVDAVSSWGGMRTSPAACKAGIYVTGPNKCLGCPPGLSLCAVSDAAWDKMTANPDAPSASMLSFTDWRNAWAATQPFPFTPSVAEINAMGAALDRYLDEGPENVWARHALTAAATRAGVKALGLGLWAAREETASPTCTAVKMPDGMDAGPILAAARERYGVTLSAGRGSTAGKLIRIGHMGPTVEPLYALIALAAVGGALSAHGVPLDIGAGLGASGDAGFAAELRAQYGIADTLWARFLTYVTRLLAFDLGHSVVFSRDVADVIMTRLPNTALLMTSAILLSAALGTLLGAVAALRRGRPADGLISVSALILNAMPGFWLGLLAIILFAVKLRWLPIGGLTTLDADHTVIGATLDVARHLVLPVFTLALTYLALYVRLMRGAMIAAGESGWVLAARARGVPERAITLRHLMRPALLPVVTMIGLQAGALLGGSVVIETVFSIPGLGALAFDAVSQRDLPLLAGILLVGTLMVVTANIVIDLVYGVLDPRVGLVGATFR